MMTTIQLENAQRNFIITLCNIRCNINILDFILNFMHYLHLMKNQNQIDKIELKKLQKYLE
jgi:hypothetical protein